MTIAPSPITLVTGANRSIGLQVVRDLSRLGHTVLLGARDPGRGAEAVTQLADEGINVDVVHIDLDSPQTHEAAAASIALAYGRIDVLVNNAAVIDANDGPATVMDIHGARGVFETNVLGTLAVTRAMLPLLRQSAGARIINLSSALGSIGDAIDRDSEFSDVRLAGYAMSKAALNMLTVQLAVELEPEGISVNAVDPGFTATDMNRHQGYQSLQQGAAEAVRLATAPVIPTGGFFATGRVLPW
ncbi:SDR family NAD(P)-dependent oxidoreductase [Luteibacter aegosomatissinici]|uniref:SDR family NAD(P)-dependent oxidoreductase n=1 Tax=Luteibacter aegosomatissinici TaxID=2911539 RepID=UPI001FFBE96D|nr:SDR family NAD(P)-dependent oxidoreductase [Luteibacter aegosomatissinici]UPG92753.1 SDR family NAD(P)-dependent oxidoreductase [Luteibacter aegosomatissinici]